MRRLSDYSEFLSAVLLSVTESTEFKTEPALEEILKIPRLVVILNHSTPLSWIPAISLLTREIVKAGGGDRTPIGIADKWLFNNPFTKPLAQYLTQSDRHLNFEELIEKFKHSNQTDLALMPEGANTFFGDVNEVHDFRSPRFVEIAVRCNAPILLVVHRGSENWSMPIPFPGGWATYVLMFSKFFGEGLMKNGKINIPLLPQKIAKFKMSCELYNPTLKTSDLNDSSQLQLEAEKIRSRMQAMFEELSG